MASWTFFSTQSHGYIKSCLARNGKAKVHLLEANSCGVTCSRSSRVKFSYKGWVHSEGACWIFWVFSVASVNRLLSFVRYLSFFYILRHKIQVLCLLSVIVDKFLTWECNFFLCDAFPAVFFNDGTKMRFINLCFIGQVDNLLCRCETSKSRNKYTCCELH